MASKIYFVSHNLHKVQEASVLLSGSFALGSIADLPELQSVTDIPETGSTFEENAQQKVDFALAAATHDYVADDSGLEVVALGGKPGVHSKRWIEGSDNDRNNYLISQLEPHENRRARFVTVLCYYNVQTASYHFFRGEVEGSIAHEPKGEDGFGYDPLFIPQGYDQTFAQLGATVKNELSHRARAFAKFKQFLQDSY